MDRRNFIFNSICTGLLSVIPFKELIIDRFDAERELTRLLSDEVHRQKVFEMKEVCFANDPDVGWLDNTSFKLSSTK